MTKNKKCEEHGKRLSRCKECGGDEYCTHKVYKWRCKDCGGASICEHGKRKSLCKEGCGGSEYCEHNQRKSRCKECGGNEYCTHKVYKARCGKCGGASLCLHCRTWLDARRAQPGYDKHCVTCFKRLFPDDPRSRITRDHTKELVVRNKIDEHVDDFIHNKPFYTSNCDCTARRRIDHHKLIGNTILAIETDEFAHKYYDKKDEEIRYHDLQMIHGGKWIFIRFNPDGKGVDMEDKLARLIDEIHTQISRIENEENTEFLEIVYLFY